MLHSKSKLILAAKASSAILLVTALAACGGGGGGDTAGTPPAGGTPPAATPPPAALTLGGLNCVAATGGGSGYVLGVCSVVTGGVEAISSQFQNFPLTVTTDASVAKRFSLNVQSPLLPGARTMDAANENCGDNQLGSKSGFLTEIYDDATKPATSPRYSVLSFAQSVGENTNLGEAALYYGGWYALRTTTNGLPTGPKTYAQGAAFGYRFTSGNPAAGIQGKGYGVSADVLTGASWNGTTLTVQINNFSYSRRSEVNPTVSPALGTLSLSGTYAADTKKVSGIVSGTGVTGIFEGEFAGATGQEFVGKFQLVQGASGDRLTGSFAVK
jgi:hypothetical protein